MTCFVLNSQSRRRRRSGETSRAIQEGQMRTGLVEGGGGLPPGEECLKMGKVKSGEGSRTHPGNQRVFQFSTTGGKVNFGPSGF